MLVDFATALSDPKTDPMVWESERFLGLVSRSIWPLKSDFDSGENQSHVSSKFKEARERAHRASQYAAVWIITNHGEWSEDIAPDWLQSALDKEVLLTENMLHKLIALVGFDWAQQVKAAAVGPGEKEFEVTDGELVYAQARLNEYWETRFEEDIESETHSQTCLSEMQAFVEAKGRVPFREERPDLDEWCKEQRALKRAGLLLPEVQTALEALHGWKWVFPYNDNNYLGNQRNVAFKNLCLDNKTTLLPFTTTFEDGTNVCVWLAGRRQLYHAGRVPTPTAAMLETLPQWTWDHEEWCDQVAFVELRNVLATGSVIDDCVGQGLFTLRAEKRILDWMHGKHPSFGLQSLRDLPGWRWGDPSSLNDLIEKVVLATALSRLKLTARQTLVAAKRLVTPEENTLEDIGKNAGTSREAIRQAEMRLLSALQHPHILHRVITTFKDLSLDVNDLHAFRREPDCSSVVAGLHAEAKPTQHYAETVLSRLYGKPISLAETRRTSTSFASREVREAQGTNASRFSDLHGTTRAVNALVSHGIDTLEDMATLDILEVSSWRNIGVQSVESIKSMREQARIALGLEETQGSRETQTSEFSDLHGTTRAINALVGRGIDTLEDMAALDMLEVSSWRNIGVQSVESIKSMREQARTALSLREAQGTNPDETTDQHVASTAVNSPVSHDLDTLEDQVSLSPATLGSDTHGMQTITMWVPELSPIKDPTHRPESDPHVSSSTVSPGVTHYVGLVPVSAIATNLPNTPNLRAANIKTQVAKDVAVSLRKNDGNFHLKNKGITMLATSVSRSGEGWDVVLTPSATQDSDGILDGGHTYAVICDARKDNVRLDKQYVFVYVRTNVPVEGNLRAQIAEALNKTTAVSAGSLLNRLGEFDWIKEALSTSGCSVAWRQNESGVKVEELVARLYACNTQVIDHHKSYSSRASTLSAYRRDSTILTSHRNAVTDVLWLYEQIVFSLTKQAEALLGKRAITSSGNQTPLIDNSYDGEKHRLVGGIALPILSSFRACLIETDNGWHFNKDRTALASLLKAQSGVLLAKVAEHWAEVGKDPGAFGKREAVWRDLYEIMRKVPPSHTPHVIAQLVQQPVYTPPNLELVSPEDLSTEWEDQLEERESYLQTLLDEYKAATGTQVVAQLDETIGIVNHEIELLREAIELTRGPDFGYCFGIGCGNKVGVPRVTDPALCKWCVSCSDSHA